MSPMARRLFSLSALWLVLYFHSAIGHALAWPFLAYGRIWAGLMDSTGADIFVPLVVMVAVPLAIVAAIAALVDSATNY